jgi:two-component sensor histidine kinase
MGPDPEERRQRIEAEQVALLYAQGLASQLVTLLNVGLVAYVLWALTGPERPALRTTLIAWVALMVLVAVARSLLIGAYRRASPPVERAPFWRSLYVAGTFAAGLSWGLAGVAIFPQVEFPYQVFLAFVLGGMAVGAAAVMSPVLAAYQAFLFPITLPVIVQLLARVDDAMTFAMGVMFTACTGMFLNSARQMHASIAESIRLRFENLDLVERAERANRSLQVEIGERTRAEDRLRTSLREKDVLLTEIHHRVKNNLQVISSLLSLQSRALTSPEAVSVFTESQNRVRSMALVHEKLYQSPDLARIDFAAYLRELASHLFRVYARAAEVQLRIRAGGVLLSIERAVPCGLIASELLSNALKYAFPGGAAGAITIDLSGTDGDAARLEIRDDGVGLPAGVDLGRPASLGLRIVKTLTAQLGGTITHSHREGATFTLVFPIEDPDGAVEHGTIRGAEPHPAG